MGSAATFRGTNLYAGRSMGIRADPSVTIGSLRGWSDARRPGQRDSVEPHLTPKFSRVVEGHTRQSSSCHLHAKPPILLDAAIPTRAGYSTACDVPLQVRGR